MRILQVVTYISPDGAYGGPVRVAINQAKALTELGHDVTVAAAAGGFQGTLPIEFDGFPVRLFPARRLVPRSGFAGLTSPGLLKWLKQVVRGVDVVHVHLARDLVTLPASALALLIRKPIVVQTHGMIDPTNKALAVPLDRLLTRPVLKAARAVLYLTDRERQDLIDVAGTALNMTPLTNGVCIPNIKAVELTDGPQTAPEVLYLARLHSRKRPKIFVQAAKSIANKFPDAYFTLIGPDEGEGATVKETIKADPQSSRTRWEGPVLPGDTLARMREASVYVLPSKDESYPMSVLEAMSLGLPVVITESCGLAKTVQEAQAGIICDESQESLASAIRTMLLEPQLRIRMGKNGRREAERNHSLGSVAHELERTYANVRQSQ